MLFHILKWSKIQCRLKTFDLQLLMNLILRKFIILIQYLAWVIENIWGKRSLIHSLAVKIWGLSLKIFRNLSKLGWASWIKWKHVLQDFNLFTLLHFSLFFAISSEKWIFGNSSLHISALYYLYLLAIQIIFLRILSTLRPHSLLIRTI